MVGFLSTSLPCSFLPSYWLGSCPQVSNVHSCILIGRAPFHKSPMFILAFLLVGLLSQVYHVHPCFFIVRDHVQKSSIFIPVVLSVRLFSTSLPCSSLPYQSLLLMRFPNVPSYKDPSLRLPQYFIPAVSQIPQLYRINMNTLLKKEWMRIVAHCCQGSLWCFYCKNWGSEVKKIVLKRIPHQNKGIGVVTSTGHIGKICKYIPNISWYRQSGYRHKHTC